MQRAISIPLCEVPFPRPHLLLCYAFSFQLLIIALLEMEQRRKGKGNGANFLSHSTHSDSDSTFSYLHLSYFSFRSTIPYQIVMIFGRVGVGGKMRLTLVETWKLSKRHPCPLLSTSTFISISKRRSKRQPERKKAEQIFIWNELVKNKKCRRRERFLELWIASGWFHSCALVLCSFHQYCLSFLKFVLD